MADLRSFLVENGIAHALGLACWQQHQIEANQMTVTFVPAMHSSGRWPMMQNQILWGDFVISSICGSVYFAGDTGLGGFMASIRLNSKS